MNEKSKKEKLDWCIAAETNFSTSKLFLNFCKSLLQHFQAKQQDTLWGILTIEDGNWTQVTYNTSVTFDRQLLILDYEKGYCHLLGKIGIDLIAFFLNDPSAFAFKTWLTFA